MTVFRPRSYAKHAAWMALACISPLLGGCGGVAYIDSRREAGQIAPVGRSTPDMVAICYSSGGGAKAQTLTLAESECAKTGRIAQFDREERWTCTMTAPRRIFYRCVAKP